MKKIVLSFLVLCLLAPVVSLAQESNNSALQTVELTPYLKRAGKRTYVGARVLDRNHPWFGYEFRAEVFSLPDDPGYYEVGLIELRAGSHVFMGTRQGLRYLHGWPKRLRGEESCPPNYVFVVLHRSTYKIVRPLSALETSIEGAVIKDAVSTAHHLAQWLIYIERLNSGRDPVEKRLTDDGSGVNPLPDLLTRIKVLMSCNYPPRAQS